MMKLTVSLQRSLAGYVQISDQCDHSCILLIFFISQDEDIQAEQVSQFRLKLGFESKVFQLPG